MQTLSIDQSTNQSTNTYKDQILNPCEHYMQDITCRKSKPALPRYGLLPLSATIFLGALKWWSPFNTFPFTIIKRLIRDGRRVAWYEAYTSLK